MKNPHKLMGLWGLIFLLVFCCQANCEDDPGDDDGDTKNPPLSSVTLTTIVSPLGSGQITPPGGTYLPGESVILTAQANPGMMFDLWQNADLDYPNPVSVTLATNKIVTAYFVPTLGYQLYGLNFSPFTGSTRPGTITEAALKEKLEGVKNYSLWFRTFSTINGMEKIGPMVREMGKKLAAGAYISDDNTRNAKEIANLIAMGQRGEIDLAIVGNEYILFHDNETSVNKIIAYLRQVRAALPPSIPVVYSDTYNILLKHPELVTESDLVFCNIYPYWEGIDLKYAVYYTRRVYNKMKTQFGKDVIIGEIGWPSAGETKDKAIPSPANAASYFKNFVSWARAENISYFYFEAYDELWKAADEGVQGKSWGIWEETGEMKPGMQSVFDGDTVADNWSGANLIDGPGTPSIVFTYVPPKGSTTWIQGQVSHVKPGETKVILFIYTGSGWYNKPTWEEPDTMIYPDGWWTNNITTGTGDTNAPQIRAYLMPIGFATPLLENEPIPASITSSALASVSVTR